MKGRFNYSKYFLSGLLLLCMVCSCHRSEELKYNGETATLSLNIPMLQSSSRADINGTPDEDAIHHLRVVILSQEAKESINKVFTKAELETGGGKVIIDNVPVGEVQMYVIANEASIGKDYSDLTTLRDDAITVQNKRKVLVKDNARIYFPKKGSEFGKENTTPETTKGLPMSWMSQFKVSAPGDQPQSVNVELQRCVAKLNIIMQSTLSEEINIKTMSFGEFFGNKLYLFKDKELNLDVPDKGDDVDLENQYVSKVYDNLENVIIPANGEKTLVCYIYPSFAWTDSDKPSPYTIGFITEKGVTYSPKFFINEFRILNSISRNTQVNITAKLSKKANINIDFEVVPWSNVTVDVPSFN